MPPNNKPSLDGIQPSKRKPEYRPDHELPAPEPTPLLNQGVVMPSIEEPDVSTAPKKKHRVRKWLFMTFTTLILVIISVTAAAFVWYQQQLAPASTDTTKHIRLTIAVGSSPSAIGDQLKSAGVIRSKLAFSVYTKLSRTENVLKAGVYNLQPSLSTPAIVERLVSGKQDTFRVTFLPGDTVANNREKIIELGYSESEVDAALSKTYNRPLFATKPVGADLEGYLYGETLEFDSSASVETILGKFFDQFESVITENNLVEGFKKQGLTLYEGITLASIVQREVPASEDQRQIAQVFFNRIGAGMTLGSDVTYQYAAKKLGVDPTPTLDSPYNTRIHAGLPPGPIAAPGKSALLAIANPADNDYLFFLSGDDDNTYFARTDAEHQQNIVSHCQKKCLIN